MWLEHSGIGSALSLPDSNSGQDHEPAPRIRGTLETLYRQEAAALRLFVNRIVRNRSEAEDIVQETFIRVWRALEQGGVNSPRAVLFKAARNLALNHIRNDRLRNSDAMRTALDDVLSRRTVTAEEQMIASEEAAACRQLMDGMPHRCREAFTLRVVDELSYKEMSQQMQLSVSTIEKHVGKGKQICRNRLAEGDSAFDVLASIVPAACKSERRLDPMAMAAE